MPRTEHSLGENDRHAPHLVHDYFGIDTEVVWDVVERDLPDLKRNVERLLLHLG